MSNFNYNKNPAPFYNKNYGSNYADNYSTFSSFFETMNSEEKKFTTKFNYEEDNIKDLVLNQGWSTSYVKCNENQSQQVRAMPGQTLYRCVLKSKQ